MGYITTVTHFTVRHGIEAAKVGRLHEKSRTNHNQVKIKRVLSVKSDMPVPRRQYSSPLRVQLGVCIHDVIRVQQYN